MESGKYKILYASEVAQLDIPELPSAIKKMVKRAIDDRLAFEPIHYGKPLRYSLKGHRRIRVSDYRIVYRVDEKEKQVIIVAIKHRKNVYGE